MKRCIMMLLATVVMAQGVFAQEKSITIWWAQWDPAVA